jgi:CheY-like chemotaxis protein
MANILIVEDNPVSQRLLSHMLRKIGHTLRITGNGQDALDILDEYRPDLAVVDIAMPIMDGLTFVQTVNGYTHLNRFPIIMLTASGQDEDRAIARANGVVAFLNKPVSSWELHETVGNHVGPQA